MRQAAFEVFTFRDFLGRGVGGFRDIAGRESGAHTFGIGSCWWVSRHRLLAISLPESEIWTAFEVLRQSCWVYRQSLPAEIWRADSI